MGEREPGECPLPNGRPGKAKFADACRIPPIHRLDAAENARATRTDGDPPQVESRGEKRDP